jgi:glycosyltransferase involved in cell wall biosynthesis
MYRNPRDEGGPQPEKLFELRDEDEPTAIGRQTMRIGVDARELGGHRTGVGTYLAGLLDEWHRQEHSLRHEFFLYSAEPIGGLPNPNSFRPRIDAGHPGTWWEQVRLPAAAAADELDVFFAPAYTAPLPLRMPVVAAIHDVSFVAHPEWFTMREGMRRRWLTRRTASAACAVITISEFTRGELVERLGVPASKVHVIPPGVRIIGGDVEARRDGLVLYVGSIFNRRHVPDLIRAFAPIAHRHAAAALHLAGDDRTFPREDLPGLIAREGLAERVQWHRYATDAEVHALYSSARAFAFLSDYEGLGLTPLEALDAGVPPVLLDTAVARESCGDAALYVERGDIAATTHALERLLFDDSTRQRLLAAAPAVLARYSWPRAARDTLAVLEGCAK